MKVVPKIMHKVAIHAVIKMKRDDIYTKMFPKSPKHVRVLLTAIGEGIMSLTFICASVKHTVGLCHKS